MSMSQKPKAYREMIDALVEVCRTGQGQIYPRRVREGVWHRYVPPTEFSDQHNLLLARLSSADRELLSGMLTRQFESGVFEALKVLEQFRVEPFEDGYEGSPYNDFVGRLTDWEWPED